MSAVWRRHARLARLRVQTRALTARAGVTFARTAAAVAAISVIAEHFIAARRAAAQRAGVAIAAAAAATTGLQHVLALRRLVDVRVATITAAAATSLLATIIALTALLAAFRAHRVVAIARVRRSVYVMLMRVHVCAVVLLM